MKFYNKTPDILQIKDAAGAVLVGPFLPGTADEGPWYDVSEISDHMFEQWTARGLIGTVD
jgi:hypothetical protein